MEKELKDHYYYRISYKIYNLMFEYRFGMKNLPSVENTDLLLHFRFAREYATRGIYNKEVAKQVAKEYSTTFDSWGINQLQEFDHKVLSIGKLSRIADIFVTRARSLKDYEEYIEEFYPGKRERDKISKYMDRCFSKIPNSFYIDFKKRCNTLQEEYDLALKSTLEDALTFISHVQENIKNNDEKTRIHFNKLIESSPVEKYKDVYISKEDLMSDTHMLTLAEESDVILENAVTSYTDYLLYHSDFKTLHYICSIYGYFILPEFCGHYIAHFYHLEMEVPLSLFAKIYIGRGGNSKYSSTKRIKEYMGLFEKEVFSKQDKYILALESLNDLNKNTPNWFEEYLKKYRKAHGFKLRFIKSSNYKYGVFNYSKWNKKSNRNDFPESHCFKEKYPLFHWSSSGDPLEYYFYQYNELSKINKNKIRTKLGLPEVGAGNVKETEVYNLICKTYKGPVVREYSPSFLGRMRYDFYLPEKSIAIEWNGEQHYRPVDFFGGEEGFKRTQERDELKRKLSKKNKVVVIDLKYDLSDSEIIEELRKYGII